MRVTNVDIKLVDRSETRLRAYCRIVLDDMLLLDELKVIDGNNGLFVAMPSHRITDRCHHCHYPNAVTARFCNGCGARLRDDRARIGADGATKIYALVAYPVNAAGRRIIHDAVLGAYHKELDLAQAPGYVSSYDQARDRVTETTPRPAA